ncbi:unnamed protein product [Adineta steineri]|uniref:MD-2-related lipid-recognition domain-containing protein n=1 Tax=Adineta steineri TaxID=433720 RepID=A0A818J3N1_9BILA|nr:unnamed protein product [Adineta steineri]CAF3533037.1 unnamed protein product [Adineta steineri]
MNSYHIQLDDVDLNSCVENKNVFNILSFNLWSDYLEMPGYLDASLSFRLTQNYSTVHSTYSIQFERKIGPLWINIPCITDSCFGQSLCILIQNSCGSIKSCNKNCQLSTGSHTLEHIRLPLKNSFFEHKIFTKGQYKFKIQIYDNANTIVGCFTGYITLKMNE